MSPSNVLLTGASRGLGLVLAKHLLEAGYRVYAVSRTFTAALEMLHKQYSGQLHFLSYDLAESSRLKENIFDNFVTPDIPLAGFVNNAAIAYDDLVTNLQLEPLEQMFRVNVFSPMMITREVIRNMLLHGTPGCVIHISSVSVHTGFKGLAMYASTKGALEAFSINTAREWRKKNIRSHAIVCGFMDTDMTAGLSPEQKERASQRAGAEDPRRIATRVMEFLGTGAA